MFFLIPTTSMRPSVLEKNKDIQYHAQFARFCLGQANTNLHSSYLEKIARNKRFYKGDQWIFEEDISTFLKDDDNQDRNRLNIVQNVIRPMVEQYRGNAIRMNINFAVKSISPKAINRREQALSKMLHFSKIANDPENPFGAEMKRKFPIGDNEAETRAMFENTYVDDLVNSVNALARFVYERTKLQDKQVTVAFSLAMNGIAIIHDFEYAGHQEFENMPAENFFWDRSSKEHDLSDGYFWGHYREMFPTEIYERFQDISPEDRRSIDRYSQFFSSFGTHQNRGQNNYNTTGKVPVFFVFWRDGNVSEWGYVKDKYGYENLVKINHTYDGEEKPRYTDKDVIISQSPKAKKILRGKKTRKLYYDELRMAIIIPKEILSTATEDKTIQAKLNDVVLDWGLAPYQETEVIEYNSVKPPYKVDTWAYIDGEVLSPMDDAIDPQRFINRMWSISENMLNNAPGTSTFYDRTLLGGTSESELQRNMNQSKPVGFEARGKGLQNAVMQFDGASKALSSYAAISNIIAAMKGAIKETTGVNDALQGGQVGTGNDQLVGVTQLMIQRGSLMQEPFYNAMVNVFKQCFDSIVSRGKRIYADNDRNITMAVGDEGGKIIKITADMKMEDFRCFTKRENSDEILRNAADQQIMTLFSLQLLDDKRVANLYGRSTPDDVARALREYAAEKQELQRMAAKTQQAQMQQQQQQMAIQQQQQRDDFNQQQAREDVRHLIDNQTARDIAAMKLSQKTEPKNTNTAKY